MPTTTVGAGVMPATTVLPGVVPDWELQGVSPLCCGAALPKRRLVPWACAPFRAPHLALGTKRCFMNRDLSMHKWYRSVAVSLRCHDRPLDDRDRAKHGDHIAVLCRKAAMYTHTHTHTHTHTV
jgi:hypothetical protein